MRAAKQDKQKTAKHSVTPRRGARIVVDERRILGVARIRWFPRNCNEVAETEGETGPAARADKASVIIPMSIPHEQTSGLAVAIPASSDHDLDNRRPKIGRC